MQPGSESAFPASIEPSEPLREVVDLDTVPASTADALSHPLRRQVLYQLSRREFMVPRDALAEHVVGATEDTGGLTAPPKRQVEVQLHHVHLPKLVEAGLVEYDHRSTMVALTPAAKRLLTP